MNLPKCTHQGNTLVRQILQRACYKKQMNFAKGAVSNRDPKDSTWRGVRIRLAQCSDSTGAVCGLDWRGVRIRLARCSDLTWRDVWSGFGLGLLASSLRLQASGFRLRAPGASAASFRLHAPGPKCRHRVCVRIRVQLVCKLRAHILRKSL